MTEHVVLVDQFNNEVGVAPKATVHSLHTPLHRAFSCFLFNDTGELLMQQRAQSKRTWPGIWSNTSCGHPAPAESTEDAVYRRLDYELSIPREAVQNLQLLIPEFRYCVRRGSTVEHELCPVYVGNLFQEPRPFPIEVEATAWLPWSQLETCAAQLTPMLRKGIPQNRETYERYRRQFATGNEYTRAHSLPSGLRISEWCLWEASLLAKNDTFMTGGFGSGS